MFFESGARVWLGRFIVVALIGGVGVGAQGLPARAQEDPPTRPAPARTVDELDGPPAAVDGAAEAPAAAPALEGAQATQGRVAFQSYRDGNWEIYIGSSDTGSVQRLTSEGASDLEPRLSPDLSRIVFTSRRTGNYELFRMDASGNGLVQLTNHGGIDSAAAWSPDGQRIAFQSNRNGNYDVFVMNADGSGLAQLTSNADYDGEPAWSPDGTQIAFVSRRTTGSVDYFLYAMNADGGNQHLLTPVPYSSHPNWSWRGHRILFDGLDGSGWQRLYVYDVDTNSVRLSGTQPGTSNTDDVSGSWGGNDTIYFTRTQYVLSNGQWYIANMQIYSGTDGTGADLRYLFGNVDGYPSWANPDHTPPMSFALSAMSYVRRGASPFVWGIVLDPGGAQAAGVDVQHRTDGGAWTQGDFGCVKYNAISWRCFLYGVDGTQYEARVRGVDAYENKEDWPGNAQSWIPFQVYQRLIQGMVRDQTGYGVSGIPIQGLDVLDGAVSTDSTGYFVAHQANANAFTISASVGGQSVSRPSDRLTMLGGVDLWADLRPAPAGNVLVNSGFDVAGSGWSAVNGASPEWLSGAAASADSPVLRLGWQTSAVDPTFSGYSPVVVYSGTTELIGHQYYGTFQLEVCPQGGTCATENFTSYLSRAMAVAPNGTLGVVFGDFWSGLWFASRSPAGVWSGLETLTTDGSTPNIQLLVDGQNRWYLLRENGSHALSLSRRNDVGVWSVAENFENFDLGWKGVMDGSNVIHVAGCSQTGVRAITWSSGVGYGLPVTLSADTCPAGYLGTHLDTSGRIYAAWRDPAGEPRYMRRSAAGVWGDVVPLTGQVVAGGQTAAGSFGQPLVAVTDGSGGWRFYEASADGANWTLLANRAIWPDLSASSILVAYNATANTLTAINPQPVPFPVVLHPRLFSASSTVAMQQVVTIPADLNRPLLSTFYRFNGSAGDVVTLGIQSVDDPSPTLLPLAPGADWQYAWRDVSAWAGKTVTVTIQLTDGPAVAVPTVDFNEVYLAAYSTPFVSAIAPQRFDTAAGTFTVTGDNFMTTPTVTIGGQAAAVTRVDAQHLTVTMPAGLAPGRYVVVVANPTGFNTVAPQPIQIGSVLTLPMMLRWMPPTWP